MLAALIAGACVIAVAGCSGESDADPEPTFTPSATAEPPTASQSAEQPVEPVPPAEMERDDEVGAKAFAEFYWEVVNYAQATGDTELLKTLEMPLCSACRGVRTWIDGVYEGAGRIVGSEQTVRVSTVVALGDSKSSQLIGYDVEARLTAGPGKVVNRKGQIVARSGEADQMVVVSVSNEADQGWRVGGWEEQQ